MLFSSDSTKVAPQVHPHPEARPTALKEDTVDSTKDSATAQSPEHPEALAGDPIAYAAHRQAQEELLQAAEATLDWLEDRRRHQPPELFDTREGTHFRALREAIRRVREA
jgi:hypothetical protein